MSNAEPFLRNLHWRYATKKFDTTKKLSADQLELIAESLRLAPSSFGVQPWKFYLLEDPDLRRRVREGAAHGQPQVTDASHILVLASRLNLSASDIDTYIADISHTRGIPESDLAGRRESILNFINGRSSEALDAWCARQLYIALGFGLMAAAQNGIDACPMEGFDPEAVAKLIGADTDGYMPRAFLALGFRSETDDYATAEKVRFPQNIVMKKL
jgi:nitroreductase